MESEHGRDRRGVCVWLTGLSGSGKTTTASTLAALLREQGREVTVLDGDALRARRPEGLGYSREDRDANVSRMGLAAAGIVERGGVAVCAAISPYRAARGSVRAMVGAGRFIEVFVDTPLAVCEARDPKGLYARARAGELSGFTGVDDPYEAPASPELTLDTVSRPAECNARRIAGYLAGAGFVRSRDTRRSGGSGG